MGNDLRILNLEIQNSIYNSIFIAQVVMKLSIPDSEVLQKYFLNAFLLWPFIFRLIEGTTEDFVVMVILEYLLFRNSVLEFTRKHSKKKSYLTT